RMLRIVPLGLLHICFRPNSFTRPSSGVIVAHFTATPYFFVALAESMVTSSPSISTMGFLTLILLMGLLEGLLKERGAGKVLAAQHVAAAQSKIIAKRPAPSCLAAPDPPQQALRRALPVQPGGGSAHAQGLRAGAGRVPGGPARSRQRRAGGPHRRR